MEEQKNPPLYQIIKGFASATTSQTDKEKISDQSIKFADQIVRNLDIINTLNHLYAKEAIPFITFLDEYYRQERAIYLRIKEAISLQQANVQHIEKRLSIVLSFLDGFKAEYKKLSDSLESTIRRLDIVEFTNHECQTSDDLERLFGAIYADIHALSLSYERALERMHKR